MPRILLLFVTLTVYMIVFLFFDFYPLRSLPPGLVSIMTTTMLLFLAQLVLTDLGNPFEGTRNVDSGRFRDLVTNFR